MEQKTTAGQLKKPSRSRQSSASTHGASHARAFDPCAHLYARVHHGHVLRKREPSSVRAPVRHLHADASGGEHLNDYFDYKKGHRFARELL